MAHLLPSIRDAETAEDWDDWIENSTSLLIKDNRDKRLPNLLPNWLVIINAKLSGTKTSENDKPIMGLIIFTVLVISSILFCVTRISSITADIVDPNTNSSFFNKLFDILITLIWCIMSIYSYLMTTNIFSSPSFLKHIRLHTRSFLMIRTGIIFIILILGFFAGNFVQSFTFIPLKFEFKNCTTAHSSQLPIWTCYFYVTTTILFSVLVTYFNLLVSCIMMSVMRTQTIVMRRQVSDLQVDGAIIVNVMKKKLRKDRKTMEFKLPRISIDSFSNNDSNEKTEADEEAYHNESIDNEERKDMSESLEVSGQFNLPIIDSSRSKYANIGQLVEKMVKNKCDVSQFDKLNLSTDELLYRYRVLFQRTQNISVFYQKWMLGWIIFMFVWIISYIIEWMKTEPNYVEIALFILPIATVFVLTSSYAEVNNEAIMFMKSIYPIENRAILLRYMFQFPLQVGIFNITLNYTTMISIIITSGLMIFSKIIIGEIKSR